MKKHIEVLIVLFGITLGILTVAAIEVWGKKIILSKSREYVFDEIEGVWIATETAGYRVCIEGEPQYEGLVDDIVIFYDDILINHGIIYYITDFTNEKIALDCDDYYGKGRYKLSDEAFNQVDGILVEGKIKSVKGYKEREVFLIIVDEKILFADSGSLFTLEKVGDIALY